jgi:hypothetical protein
MDVAFIVGSAIVTLPPTLMAALAWKKSKRNQDTLGDANGHGTVVEIGEKLLLWSVEHQRQDEERFNQILAEQRRVQAELSKFKADGTNPPT